MTLMVGYPFVKGRKARVMEEAVNIMGKLVLTECELCFMKCLNV